jgi:hypothetical protein
VNLELLHRVKEVIVPQKMVPNFVPDPEPNVPHPARCATAEMKSLTTFENIAENFSAEPTRTNDLFIY